MQKKVKKIEVNQVTKRIATRKTPKKNLYFRRGFLNIFLVM